ncbi:MAG TPA: alpha/beta hydrolase-fold protein, partial [Planctomycetota bacterium]|nr:alpha/beta hydrolase-fold protein [Planctomycetota bacterium]
MPLPLTRIASIATCLLVGVSSALHAAQQTIPPPLPVATNVQAVHSMGHTFITWDEVPGSSGGSGPQVGDGETYVVYVSDMSFGNDLSNATAIELNGGIREIPEDSSRLYTDYYFEVSEGNSHFKTWPCAGLFEGQFEARHSKRLWVRDINGTPVKVGPGKGVLVLTPKTSGTRYYAVTTIPAGGEENTYVGPENTSGEVVECDNQDPEPILLPTTVSNCGSSVQVYLQYMDPEDWNVTVDAPHALNCYYGFEWEEPGVPNRIAKAIQYAYTYEVAYPAAAPPSGETWAATLFLHGRGGDIPICPSAQPGSVLIRCHDYIGSHWYGAARDFDYRDLDPSAEPAVVPEPSSDVIVNYTEQRVMRALYDTLRWNNANGPTIDLERLYVRGHSMGGGGALGMALHYPTVFAAAHSSKGGTAFGDEAQVSLCGLEANNCFEPTGSGVNLLSFLWGAAEGTTGNRVPTEAYLPAFKDEVLTASWEDVLEHYSLQDEDTSPYDVYAWQDHRTNLAGAVPAGLPVDERRFDEVPPLGTYHSHDDATVSYCRHVWPLYPDLGAGARAGFAELLATGEHEDLTNEPGVSGVNTANGGFGLGMPPALMPAPGNVPFWGHRVILSETVPGFSLPPGFPVPLPCGTLMAGSLFARIDWASSWRTEIHGIPGAQAPIEDNDPGATVHWEMHFALSQGPEFTVDISPRRLQVFVPVLDSLGEPPYVAEVEYVDAVGGSMFEYPTVTGVKRLSDGKVLLTIHGVEIKAGEVRTEVRILPLAQGGD